MSNENLNSLWERDDIQFPRLLAEIIATQDGLDYAPLMESMDLTEDELDELFDRAQCAWDNLKDAL